jgi:Cu-Zn family superoxide dismutase
MKRYTVLVVIATALLAAVAGAALAQEAGTGATAELLDAQGNVVGSAQFTEGTGGGGVVVTVQAQSLTPGEHGIHLHETGACEGPAFESAGGHINPTGAQHGLENPQGPHAGDLPGLSVGADGTASYQATNTLVTLSGGGAGSLLDADGSALVIHAAADDQVTDPTGNSGDRVACGVIEAAGAAATGTMPNTGGVGILALLSIPLLVLAGAGLVGTGLLIRRVRRA